MAQQRSPSQFGFTDSQTVWSIHNADHGRAPEAARETRWHKGFNAAMRRWDLPDKIGVPREVHRIDAAAYFALANSLCGDALVRELLHRSGERELSEQPLWQFATGQSDSSPPWTQRDDEFKRLQHFYRNSYERDGELLRISGNTPATSNLSYTKAAELLLERGVATDPRFGNPSTFDTDDSHLTRRFIHDDQLNGVFSTVSHDLKLKMSSPMDWEEIRYRLRRGQLLGALISVCRKVVHEHDPMPLPHPPLSQAETGDHLVAVTGVHNGTVQYIDPALPHPFNEAELPENTFLTYVPQREDGGHGRSGALVYTPAASQQRITPDGKLKLTA